MALDSWKASGSAVWTTSADWSLGAPPTSAQDAFVGTAASGTVVINAAETVNSIGIGANYTLDITTGGSLTATAGTGSQSIAGTGTVTILNFGMFTVGGDLDNAGTIAVRNGGNFSIFDIASNANVTLFGGGNVAMNGAGGGLNFFSLSSGATLVNFDNDISGTGAIAGGTFLNQGIVETNNGFGAGTLEINGNTGGFSFTNARHGLVRADAGGTLILGSPSFSSSQITNRGTLQLLASSSKDALLEIAGNVTIGNTGGVIGMDGGFANRIQSNGSTASLTVNGGTIEGSGYLGNGDSNLTLTIGPGTIVNNNNGHGLFVDTGTSTIVNDGTLESTNGELRIQSPLTNDGTILALNGGDVILAQASSTGSIVIGNGGNLDVQATLTGNVTFAGTGATLFLRGQINGDVVGARPGDTFDFQNQSFAAGDKNVWQQNGATGTLMLETSTGMVLQSLTLFGQYASADFSAPADDTTFGTQIGLVAVPVTVQTAGGVDLRWATLYDELANSPIAGATSTQYTAVDTAHFNGHTANILFVVSGTGFTYSGSVPNIQLTGGTITQFQVEDLSNNVLATFASLSIPATAFQAAINSYIAGGASPNATALNAIFLSLIYNATGGTGADNLQGGNAPGTFDASTGNDTLAGGTGPNTADYSGLTTPGLVAIVQGGGGTVNKGGANGSDTLTSVQNIIDNGTGRGNSDVFYVDAGETVTANSSNFNFLIELTAGVNLAYGANFTGITEFVSNVGSNVVDFSNDGSFAYLYGSTGNDTLSLGTGGGYMFGEGGTNTLNGGENATNIFEGGSGGTDIMNGGIGTANNFYYVDSNDFVHGAGAFNTVIELVNGVVAVLGGQYQNVQEFVSDGGNNNVAVEFTDSDFTYLYGGAGNDTLTTGSGGGYLIGEGGTNDLFGGGGTNVFVADGASGADTMNGGSGSNIYFIDSHSTVLGAGTFNTVIELQQNVSLTLGSAQLGTDVQQVVLNGGTNTVDFHTATGAVFLYGGAGNDTLFGGAGDDFLFGGTGTNTFTFGVGWGHDTIMDWTTGTTNQIDLTALSGLNVHAITDLTQNIVSGNDVITSSHTGTNSITLMGVGSALTAGSFHFG